MMSIGKLRRELPLWSWTFKRGGPEVYMYTGTKGDRSVEIFSRSHVGEFEDHCYVTWYADEKNLPVVTFCCWLFNELGEDQKREQEIGV